MTDSPNMLSYDEMRDELECLAEMVTDALNQHIGWTQGFCDTASLAVITAVQADLIHQMNGDLVLVEGTVMGDVHFWLEYTSATASTIIDPTEDQFEWVKLDQYKAAKRYSMKEQPDEIERMRYDAYTNLHMWAAEGDTDVTAVSAWLYEEGKEPA